MSYPPIKNGTKVQAQVKRDGKGDYTGEALRGRSKYNGQIGVVCEHHDSHGLCYGVKFGDGTIAFYDPEELEVLEVPGAA